MPTHQVSRVRAEYADPTPWVPTAQPRLSWQNVAAVPNWRQDGAELSLTRAHDEAAVATARLAGAESVFVDWPFERPLPPRERFLLRVRTAGPDGEWSDWSAPLELRSAMLAPQEWTARPIAHPDRNGPVLLRQEFTAGSGVVRATLYAAACGVYQASLNGVDVDDHVLKPGWSSFDLRLPYETTDVTDLLVPGANALGIRLAGGWFTELYHRRDHDRVTWGERPSVAGQLVLEYADGARDVIVTDGSWSAATGETLTSGIYLGESVDACREPDEWTQAEVTEWGVTPTPRIAPPARRIEQRPAVSAQVSPTGATILDFGQNVVGRLRLRVRAPRGTTLTLRHAEVLEHGELALRPLRFAAATDTYVHAGGERVWEPEFTFHGFRYASIEGMPGGVNPADVTAMVIHSDMARTGWFSCSDPLVTKLHENIVWSMRDNFLHLPTDCPQRDERQGWTGDLQVFAPTATTLYDVGGFLASWLTDLRLEQEERGAVPFIVPDVVKRARPPAAAWGDAATVVPWALGERLGDTRVLVDQFASMCGWVEQLIEAADDDLIWRDGFQFGDWLDPDAPPEDPAAAKVPAEVVATAYFHRSASITAQAARRIGRIAEADRYDALAEAVRLAWIGAYLEDDGARVRSDAPTGYALAIAFDLVRGEARVRLGERLAELLAAGDHRVPTGFVGTPILADALTMVGRDDVAARLLLQTECPSWLYPVTMGATTVWERWDSMLPDGTINPGEMTSFNHYALGAVADWLHRVVAGLAPAAPGYARLLIAPRPLRGLHHASSTVDTPYGPAGAGWAEMPDGSLRVSAEVPANTTARVELPGGTSLDVGSGRHSWIVPDPRPR